MQPGSTQLPPEIADRFTKPFARFLKIESAAGALLLVAALVALILSNSPWSAPFLAFWETPIDLRVGGFDYERTLRGWINDGLMTLFFFVVALELKRELVLGELRSPRMAALSFAGALGGMVAPALIYVTFMFGEPGMHGWGTVMATDTAFVVGCLALLGRRIPASLRVFLLSLAIFDDVGAILVVAIGYGHALNWTALAAAALGLAVVAASARIGIRSVPIYFLYGIAIWVSIDASGIHPTLTGVILALMTPTGAWVSDERLHAIMGRVLSYPLGDRWSGEGKGRRDLASARIAATEAQSPVERLEAMLHPWVSFAIMPIFALANAGVAISGADLGRQVTVAVFAGFVLGKPVGVLATSWLAVRLGLAARSPGLSWPLLGAGAILTGIGFTMSLFIAGLAYAPDLLDAAKIGILAASIASASAGLLSLAWLTSNKMVRPGATRRQ